MNGYIKLERKIFEWQWYTEQDTARMFVHLLLKANHTYAKVNDIEIFRGQMITSIPKLSDQLGMSFFKVRKAIFNLKKTGEIKVETTNNYSRVIICKYNDYQGEVDPNPTVKTQSNNIQNTTNNNDNNVKNEILQISEWKNWYLNNNRIINSVCKSNKFEKNFVLNNLEAFVKHNESTGNIEETIYEYNRHFLSYLRKIKSSIGRTYKASSYNKRTF